MRSIWQYKIGRVTKSPGREVGIAIAAEARFYWSFASGPAIST